VKFSRNALLAATQPANNQTQGKLNAQKYAKAVAYVLQVSSETMADASLQRNAAQKMKFLTLAALVAILLATNLTETILRVQTTVAAAASARMDMFGKVQHAFQEKNAEQNSDCANFENRFHNFEKIFHKSNQKFHRNKVLIPCWGHLETRSSHISSLDFLIFHFYLIWGTRQFGIFHS
jgi:hypothetical protein